MVPSVQIAYYVIGAASSDWYLDLGSERAAAWSSRRGEHVAIYRMHVVHVLYILLCDGRRFQLVHRRVPTKTRKYLNSCELTRWKTCVVALLRCE